MDDSFTDDQTNDISGTIDEVNVHCDRKDKALYIKYYLSAVERRELIKTLGDPACMLFEYYLRMASIPNQIITDNLAAEYFGWNSRKVRRYRQALQQAGWYAHSKYSISKHRRGVSYYIGREAVARTRR